MTDDFERKNLEDAIEEERRKLAGVLAEEGESEDYEESAEENPWDIDPEELDEVDSLTPAAKDEVIKALDLDAISPADVALKNFAASFANLTPEDIEEICILGEMYEECVKYASVPVGAILPEEVLELKINSMRRKIALSRAKSGKMMDLFLKHWTVVSHAKEPLDIQPDKPSWFRKLARMFK